MKKRRRRKKRPIWARVKNAIRRTLISGMLIVVPLGMTVFVMRFFYGITAGFVATIIRPYTGPLPPALVAALLYFPINYLVE